MTSNVLLVEDDELTRMCLADMLVDAGWRVATATSAEQALQMGDAQGTPDIIVTDFLLGRGISGTALIVAARNRWPGIRAVLISGADMVEPALADGDRFLYKPFRGDTLTKLLAEPARTQHDLPTDRATRADALAF